MKHLIGWSYFNCRYYLALTEQNPEEWTITLPGHGSNYRFRGMTLDDSVVVLGPTEMYWHPGSSEWLYEVYAYLLYRGVSWIFDETDRYRQIP